MRLLFIVPVLVASLASPAIAGVEAWQSQSGTTTFESAVSSACAGKEVLVYTTRYGNTNLIGNLWVKSIRGCQSNGVVSISGYFEEQNSDRGQWCKGYLTLNLVRRPVGSRAVWQQVKPAQPGYRCSGAGESVSLPLIYIRP